MNQHLIIFIKLIFKMLDSSSSNHSLHGNSGALDDQIEEDLESAAKIAIFLQGIFRGHWVIIFSWPPWGVNSRRGCDCLSHIVCLSISPNFIVYNYGSGCDTFLKSFGHILGMFVDYFWFVQNFLYVCQSVSWLTSLLKLDKSSDISSSGWDIFLKFFGDIPGMYVH